MPITYDLRKDIRFQEGFKKGFEEGWKRNARFSVIYLLRRGIFPPFEISEDLGIPLDFVLDIQEQLAENPNLK